MRFPEFSDEWKRVLGNELFKPISNKKHNSDLPIVAVTQNQGVALRDKIDFKISVSDKSISTYKIVEKGDFVISLRSFQGGIEYSDVTGICSPAYTILKPILPIVAPFYKSYLKQSRYIAKLNERLEGIRDGKNISFENFSIIPLPYPSLEEQEKIATFLSLIDERIATQNKIIEEYKKLKDALTESLFYPNEREKSLKFNKFNDKWELLFLKDVVVNFSRRNKSHIQYPMYSVTNDLGFVPQSEKFEERTMMGEDISSYKVINNGDFAYNPARINVGSIAKYEGDNPCMISSLYVCFRPKYNISSEWLQYLLKSQRMIYNYNLFGEGGVRIYLFFPNFGRIKISVPSIEEQEKIAAVISSIEQKISVEHLVLDILNTQKSYLLTKMFI